MAVELGTGYVSIVASAKGIGNQIGSELGAPLEKAGKDAGQRSSSGFAKVFKTGLGGVKTAAIAAGSAIGGGLLIGGALEHIGSQFDEAFDKIRVGTGATGVALEGLQNSTKNVFKSLPVSLGDASSAITDLNQKLGLSGKPLEALSTQFLNLSRTTGTDLKTNISSVAGLFNQFGVAAGQQGQKLDELFRVSQKTGVSVSDLADQMSQSGPVFKQAGFSFEQSASLLGLLGKNGLSVSDVLPSISKSLAVAAKAGKPAQQVFQDTFAAIKGAPNDTKAAGIALDVFGAKAGPKFAALIRSGQLSYEDFAKAIASGGDTINKAASDTDDWREKLTILKNKALVAIEPVASRVFGALTTGLEKVSAFLPGFVAKVKLGFSALAGAFSNKDVTSDGFVGVMERIGVAARKVVDFFVRNWPTIQTVVSRVLGVLQAALGKVVQGLAAFGKFATQNKEAVAAFVAVLGGLLILNSIAKAILAVNLAIAANPFVLLAVAIAAVVAGIVYAYFHFKRFRDIVDSVVQFVVKFKLVFIGLAAVMFGPITTILALAAAVVLAYNRFVVFRNIVQTTFTVIKTIVTIVLTSIIIQIRVFVAIATALWSTFGGAIRTVVSTVFNFIRAYITATLNIIRGVILVVTSLIHGDWGKAWDGVKQILSGVWNQMKAIVQLALGLIKAQIQAVWATVKAVTSTAWNTVKTIVSGAWTTIKAAVSTGVTNVTNTIRTLPGKAVSALSTLASGLVRVITTAFAAMARGAISGITDVAREVSHLPSAVLGVLSDIGSVLFQKGVDLIMGLAKGAASAAARAAASIASSVAHAVAGAAVGGIKKIIPGLASGGVVKARRGGTLVRIGEGGMDEAVVPLAGQRPQIGPLSGLSSVGAASTSYFDLRGSFFADDHVTATRKLNDIMRKGQRDGAQITFHAA